MADNSEVQIASAYFFSDCWVFAATILLVYDYVLTFSSEVTIFWLGGRMSGATILFLLNRYTTLVAQIMNAVPLPSSVKVCTSTSSTAFSQYVAYIVVRDLQYLPWAAFSALRSYALCPGHYRWPVSATVFALSSVPFITNMWVNLYKVSLVNITGVGITPTEPISANTILKRDMTVTVATRSCMIASDLVVLCVTWFRTYETVKLSLRSIGKQTFASILLLNGASHRDTVSSLTAILTSRFLIDLQRTQRKLAGSSRSVSLGELVFQPQTSRNTNRFIGSLGAQLSFHEDSGEENEVEDMS
ncbi:hypothetical protein BD311DRAFT_839535 [Dichomitus squalens]|uniref:DUF6533 domain-containing protein n=1 Tax=Dichomitus squalens TaxID=114155 RepID=A0A4Q9ML22_9APHY|nr:hypothetical protein BD311DRAFT_839535 [Dichomitus squalens]